MPPRGKKKTISELIKVDVFELVREAAEKVAGIPTPRKPPRDRMGFR
jgi:hypothetical protein